MCIRLLHEDMRIHAFDAEGSSETAKGHSGTMDLAAQSPACGSHDSQWYCGIARRRQRDPGFVTPAKSAMQTMLGCTGPEMCCMRCDS